MIVETDWKKPRFSPAFLHPLIVGLALLLGTEAVAAQIRRMPMNGCPFKAR